LYKSFEIISDFVRDLWECDFLETSLDTKTKMPPELERACHTMVTILNEQRKPSAKELAEDIYPLLEVSVPWERLKGADKFPPYFLEHYRPRMKTRNEGVYYGSIFEIKIASFCLLSGHSITFSEDYADKSKQIDFVLNMGTQPQVFGVECTSKRLTENLTLEDIKQTIEEKAEKFKPEHIDHLRRKIGTCLDKKLLVVEITRDDYATPPILSNLNDLDKEIVNSIFDGVTFVWTEDILVGRNHSLRPKSKIVGAGLCFTPEIATEIHVTPDGPVLFTRKYVEPEPTCGVPGPEETNEQDEN
jgi:hypothetical protein